MIDPGGDPTALRLELARMGTRTAAILVTHTDVDHVAGVAELAEGTGAEVWAPAGELEALREGVTRGGAIVTPYEPEHAVADGDAIAVAGLDVRGRRRARALAPATSRSSPTGRSSRATSCSRAPSAASTSRAATGTRCSSRCAGSSTATAATPSSIRATARRRRSGASSTRTRSCASSASRQSEPRSSRRRAGRTTCCPAEQPLWQRVTGTLAEVAELYGYRRIQTPNFEDTDLFQRTSGQRLGHRPEGDVHVHRPGRPLAHAPAGGDGADRARVRRARDAPRPAAGEALHGRADVPLRRAAEGPVPRALAVLGRGDRLGRPGARRRGDPALHRVRAPGRDHAVRAAAELDRRRGMPPGLRRAAHRLARRARGRARRRRARQAGARTHCASST